ncbi:MAG: GNAT family N-acetyltransferase, partial [Kiloniellaceae bacterium]
AIAVRAVRREDHAQWLALWHAYNVFYGRSWGPDGAPPVEPEVTAAAWARFFDDAQPLWALVAEDGDAEGEDGRLVGFTHYLFHLGTNSVAPLCYLEDLFTVEAARGRGVGRALIQAVCDAAKAAGSARVYWQTQEDNATARRLYDRVAQRPGFIIYQRDL